MKILVTSFILVLTLQVFALNSNDGGKGTAKNSIDNEDSEMSFFEKINSSLSCFYESTNIWWTSPISVPDSIKNVKIPQYPDYIYAKRIENLDEQTPIKLDFNEHVLKYINAYGVRNRDKLEIVMTRSAYYFPIFEECLDKYNLPLELKYLAAVESALDPTAVSKSGAVGLWQFMKPTSDILGMNVSSYIDERRDVYISTDAACRYLKYLYETFGDWQLALVAYNGGPGTVKKAIARSGGKTDYWELRPYFTEQMQNYVPAFIAMNYLMAYHAEHNIFPKIKFIESVMTDTLHVSGYLHLKNIADACCVDFEMLKKLNPVYTYGYIPMDGNDHTLVLPIDITHLFLQKSNEICALKDSVSDTTTVPPFMVKPIREKIMYHIVVSGDNLFRLSMTYKCTVPEIYLWNGLTDSYVLKIGDRLKIMVE